MRNIFLMVLPSLFMGIAANAAQNSVANAAQNSVANAAQNSVANAAQNSVANAAQNAFQMRELLLQQGVPEAAATEALLKYDLFEPQIVNKGYFVIVDMTQSSDANRFFIVNKETGEVISTAVAHGEGSDPRNTGFAEYFSNVPDSRMTSLGAYLIQEKYRGKHGESLKLDGLEDTNNNVRARTIVLHPARYVNEGRKIQGMSWGCPAVANAAMSQVLSQLSNGAFMYIYGQNKRSATIEAAGLAKWSKIPKSQWPDESE